MTRKSGTFIPNAGAVPEPESWALMIAGFGMVGAVMSGRSKTAVAA
ncbi:MAG: PEPxxWA-CTERM sorting domain-containing protein [Sandarakinorhabdus sp.]|nr:PEPxxWA-CTERM sorting domain-containing protein [Sandarakinorhabdus sp.]